MPLNACTCSPDVNNAWIGFSMISEVNSEMTDYFFHSFFFFFYRGTARQNEEDEAEGIGRIYSSDVIQLEQVQEPENSSGTLKHQKAEMRQQTTVELGQNLS